ncbi:hypothetical protein [Streptomyces sp. NBC_00083]|uniref:hypothetical protein n=1 Tax=Streptomyces sp. NBC_00083 TaxID=2975647 RepID=UPI00224E5E8D|nr:hypothetical protein [Streptomyces sp. NBC_00083]MCX5384750.1 hypothetical protein [Streptomyces sp. NBC_00083]
MKSKFSKALAVSAVVIALGGVAAPAYADVATGGHSAGVASGSEPFVAGRWMHFAHTTHVHTADAGRGWATATHDGTAVGGEESSLVVIR